MPEKYEIEIDDRAVLVEIKQYDSAGEEVSVFSISVPDRAAEQRDAPIHAEQKCPWCYGFGIINRALTTASICPFCNATGISNRSAGG